MNRSSDFHHTRSSPQVIILPDSIRLLQLAEHNTAMPDMFDLGEDFLNFPPEDDIVTLDMIDGEVFDLICRVSKSKRLILLHGSFR